MVDIFRARPLTEDEDVDEDDSEPESESELDSESELEPESDSELESELLSDSELDSEEDLDDVSETGRFDCTRRGALDTDFPLSILVRFRAGLPAVRNVQAGYMRELAQTNLRKVPYAFETSKTA